MSTVQLTFYIPGNSVLHRLNPLTKLALVLAFLMICFPLMHPLYLFLMFFASLGLAALCGRRVFRRVLLGVVVLLPAAFAMAMFQCFWTAVPPPWRVACHLGPLRVTYEGLWYGYVFAGRILAMGTFTFLMVVVTHPSDLFGELRERLKLPYTFCFMALASLQFIPILWREATVIISAQQSRGLPARGFQAFLANFIPLFASAWERARVLAMSLEARAFGSSGKKTRLREVPFTLTDKVVSVASLVLGAVILYIEYLNNWFNFMRTYWIDPTLALVLALTALNGFIAFMVYFLVRLVVPTGG